MIVSQRRMNVVDKQEPLAASHEGLGGWGSGSSEKLRRIAELEANMRDALTGLERCKAQINEVGENERQSTFKIRDIQEIIKKARHPEDTHFEGALASMYDIFENAKDVYGSCMIQVEKVRDAVTMLGRRQVTHDELMELEARLNKKIDLLTARSEGRANAIIDQFHDSGVEFRKLVRRIDRLEVWKGQLEAGFDEMHHEGHSAIVHSGRHPQPMPDDHARHREPLYIMPPDDDYAEPYDAQSWDFDKVRSSMKANLAKYQT